MFPRPKQRHADRRSLVPQEVLKLAEQERQRFLVLGGRQLLRLEIVLCGVAQALALGNQSGHTGNYEVIRIAGNRNEVELDLDNDLDLAAGINRSRLARKVVDEVSTVLRHRLAGLH